jgi:hypothetical protein
MAKKNMTEVLMATTLETLAAECRVAGGIHDVPLRFCVALLASGKVIELMAVTGEWVVFEHVNIRKLATSERALLTRAARKMGKALGEKLRRLPNTPKLSDYPKTEGK